MNKKIEKYLTICIMLLANTVYANDNTVIKSGTYTKVIPQQEINTLTADKDDIVTFINLQDLYMYETNIIPEDTIFYGYIEDIKEPVRGKDGAIKIAINKMITPDKKVYNIKGHICGDKENYLGGKQTKSAYYHKLYNHTQGFRPMLQVVPLNVNEQGRHTVVQPGRELFIIIEDDVMLK